MYKNSYLKRTWVEINLERIINNYKLYKESCNNKEIMAVVKADAYGHGCVRTAYALQVEGVKLFAVSNIEEAIELRDGGINGEILVLGYTPVDYAELLLKYNITQTLLDENHAKILANKGIKAQFAIDTGMNRIGLNGDDLEYCEKIIRTYYNKFELNGIFTHLCVADTNTEECNYFTEKQIHKFNEIVKRVADLNLLYVHCMNSAGGLFHIADENISKIVRLGIMLYGLNSNCLNTLPVGIKPVLEWKSVIAMIKTVHSGESIGYGRSFFASQKMKVATVPIGYADGYRRELSNKGKVAIKGKKASIVGKICMDQLMIDVTGLEVEIGDEVILIGDHYSADKMSQDVGTIAYEIVCGISKRVPRIFI